MGLQDPNAPYDDFEARYLEAMTGVPSIPPAPVVVPAPPEESEPGAWEFAKRALSMDSVRELGADARDAFAPAFAPIDPMTAAQRALSETVSPPRTDAARIAQATGPTGTVGQIGKQVDPTAPAQPAIGELPTFTPDELAMVGQPQLQAPPMPGNDASGGKLAEPDAISGGMVPGQAIEGAHHTQSTPQMPDDYLSDQELGEQWAGLSLEEREKKRGEIEGARQKFTHARFLEESTRAAKAAEQNARDYETAIKASQQKAAQLDLDAQRLAGRDPIGDISTGQKVAGAIAMMIGGFTGNSGGIETVDKMIAHAVGQQAKQLGAIGSQRSALSDQVAQSGDLYHAQKAVQLAAWDQTIKKLETEVQNFDPRGTQALKYMDTITQARAKRAELLAKYQADEQKRIEAELKQRLEVAKVQEDARKNKANEKLEGWRIGETAKHNRAGEKNDAAQLDLEAKKLVASGNKDAAAQLLERGIGGSPVLTTDENGNPKASFKLLSQADGTPFVAPTKEEAILFRKKKAASDMISSLMAETIKLVQEHGWEPDFMLSPALQKARANWSTIKVKQKDFQDLGAITSADAPIIDGLMGAKDPTGLRNIIPGLEKAFDNTVKQFNEDLRSVGYTGEEYAPTKTWQLGKPAETAADRAFKESEKRPGALDVASAYGKAETLPARAAVVDAAEQGMTPEQLATISGLVATMNDDTKPQPERDAARARLNEGAAKAQTESIRDAYTRALTGGLLESIPAGSD